MVDFNRHDNMRSQATIVHVTEEAVDELKLRLARFRVLGNKCFRIEAGRDREFAELLIDRQRPQDVTLQVGSQVILAMDSTSVRACEGKILHFDEEDKEFCWVCQ